MNVKKKLITTYNIHKDARYSGKTDNGRDKEDEM